MKPASLASSPPCLPFRELPDRSILLIDPDPAAVLAGFRRALERVGACGPRLPMLAASLATGLGSYARLGIGSLNDVSYIHVPRPRGGRALRIFPGPAAEKISPFLLNAIVA